MEDQHKGDEARSPRRWCSSRRDQYDAGGGSAEAHCEQLIFHIAIQGTSFDAYPHPGAVRCRSSKHPAHHHVIGGSDLVEKCRNETISNKARFSLRKSCWRYANNG